MNLAMEFVQGKRLTCVGCAMLMSAKYKHCFWKRLYEHVDEMYVVEMEKTYGVVHIPFGSLVSKQWMHWYFTLHHVSMHLKKWMSSESMALCTHTRRILIDRWGILAQFEWQCKILLVTKQKYGDDQLGCEPCLCSKAWTWKEVNLMNFNMPLQK